MNHQRAVSVRRASVVAVGTGLSGRSVDDNNAHGSSAGAPNDTGVPKTPSDGHPNLPNPSKVVPADRDEEATVAQETHGEAKEGLSGIIGSVFGGASDDITGPNG